MLNKSLIKANHTAVAKHCRIISISKYDFKGGQFGLVTKSLLNLGF